MVEIVAALPPGCSASSSCAHAAARGKPCERPWCLGVGSGQLKVTYSEGNTNWQMAGPELEPGLGQEERYEEYYSTIPFALLKTVRDRIRAIV